MRFGHDRPWPALLWASGDGAPPAPACHDRAAPRWRKAQSMTRSNRSLTTLLAAALAAVVGLTLAGGPAAAAVTATPSRTWGTNGRVLAIAPVGDRVYVAGDFTAVTDPSGRSYPASRLAVFVPSTGRFDLTFAPAPDASVTTLAVSGSSLFVGGAFTTIAGAKRKKLAKLVAATGVIDPTWSPVVDRPPDTVAVSGTKVYVGGPFAQAAGTGGVLAARPWVARFDTTSGSLDTTWSPTPNDRVLSVRPADDGASVYLGGNFTTVGGSATQRGISRVSATTGAVTAGFVPGNTNQTSKPPVYDITQSGSRLYLAVAGSGGACTAMDAVTGAVAWSKHTNGNLQGVQVVGGVAYCGGHFTGAGGFDNLTRYKLAAVDTATGTTLPYAPVVNSALGVWSMAADSGRVYIGGDFTQIDATPQTGLAVFVDESARTVTAAPSTLVAAPGDSAVILHWDVPSTDGGSPLQRYRVYRSDDAATTWALVGTTTDPDLIDTTAVNDTTYRYRVTALNAVGESAPSAEVSARPSAAAATAPGVPGGLVASGTYNADRLTWTTPASGGSAITGYRVYRGTTSGATTLYASTTGSGTTFTDTAVTVGTRYYYRVSAVNAVGESVLSPEEWAVPTNGLPSPPVLSGTARTGANDLTWTEPAKDGGSPVTQYVVLRDSIRVAVLPATTRAWTDTAVVRGTAYGYRVKAVNAIGSSPLSATVVLTGQ